MASVKVLNTQYLEKAMTGTPSKQRKALSTQINGFSQTKDQRMQQRTLETLTITNDDPEWLLEAIDFMAHVREEQTVNCG